MSGPSNLEWRQGKRRLRAMLPSARVDAARMDGSEMKSASALYDAQRPYVTEDNLDTLVIYPAPLGGWHCDLVLRDVPHMVPNTLGSPVGQPFRTLADAEEFARTLLAMAVYLSRQAVPASRPGHAPPGAAFLLRGITIRLRPDVVAKALGGAPEGAGRYPSKAVAIARIEDVLALYLPGEVTLERFNAMGRNEMARVMTVLHMAALTGVFAYPARVDASPSGHGPHPVAC